MVMTARTPKEQYLDAYDREHATTMRVLRAYPVDRLDLRPHPKCKTARELAWVFIVEMGFTDLVLNDGLRDGIPSMNQPATRGVVGATWRLRERTQQVHGLGGQHAGRDTP